MEDLSQHSSNPIGQTLTPIYNDDNNKNISSSSSSLPHFEPESEPEPEPQSLKAKITSHPHYSTLLHAYVDCHSVGAPPDVASRLSSSLSRHFHHHAAADHVHAPKTPDPELDHFMEVYCEMLACYREELTRPLKEAMDFITMVESQLNSLSTADEKCGAYSLGEQQEDNGGDIGISEIHDSVQSDRELKRHLLKKYGGCLGSLKQQLSKKKKKGKLPKDARQKLLGWWDLHYKWPYPSENEKVALAESTGLNQKQINNWFINQRKRHWKPSDNHQQFVLEGYHPQNPKSTPDAAFCAEDGRFVGSDGLYCMGP